MKIYKLRKIFYDEGSGTSHDEVQRDRFIILLVILNPKGVESVMVL